MKHKSIFLALAFCSLSLFAASENEDLQQEIKRLQQQTQALQTQLNRLQNKLVSQTRPNRGRKPSKVARLTSQQQQSSQGVKEPVPESRPTKLHQESMRSMPTIPASNPLNNEFKHAKPEDLKNFHSTLVSVHTIDTDPDSMEFYPTALISNERVVTYIAGTPVVTSPYLGSRPAFDGSDYIVNISSINRDIRLMQQRRRLYRAYESIGYPTPTRPIVALSGKVEPVGTINQPYFGSMTGDLSLGSSEIDIAAGLNDKVEGYIGIAYDSSAPRYGQRIANSNVYLNMGFVNIGDLDESPVYFTAGQLYVPFGRFSTSMVSTPLPLILGRTKSRPFILGYKSQEDTGPFAAVYAFKSDTTLGTSGVGGINAGYVFGNGDTVGEVGASFISSMNDAGGLQVNGSIPGTTFGGFASPTNGSEAVRKIPGLDLHGYINFDRYNLSAEWVSSTKKFTAEDLSFRSRGAQPQAGQAEAAVTFMLWNKPSSLAIGYQWTREALALNLPKNRISGVFNISVWKDTVESLEFRHDIGYGVYDYANGIAPIGVVNRPIVGVGQSADTLLAQIGIYF